MGQDSKIEWTHHTFNPWWGCVKVSPGCAHCYAETFAKRTGNAVWGAESSRRFFGDKHWNEPRKWNTAAQAEGQRKRVFCASMADAFRSKGWTVIVVTGAKQPQDKLVRMGLTAFPIVYALGVLKRNASRDAGYGVNVWVDDMPGTIEPCRILSDHG